MHAKTWKILAFISGLGALSSQLYADTPITGNLSVSGDTDVIGDLTIGTNSVNSDWGVDFAYTDSTQSFDFTANRAANTWNWKQNGGGTFKLQMSLDSGNKLSLFDSSGTAQITLDPANTSTITNSLTVDGTDNEMPNQTLVNANSVLTQGLADQRYLSGSLGGLSFLGGSIGEYGWYSTAIGLNATASGHVSFALGNMTTTSGDNAFAMGDGSTAAGSESVAFGNGVTATAYNSFVIGRNNVGGGDPNNWVTTDALFEVGNGTPGAGITAGYVITNYIFLYNVGYPSDDSWIYDGGTWAGTGNVPGMREGIIAMANDDTGDMLYGPGGDGGSVSGYTIEYEIDYWVPPVDLQNTDALVVYKNGNTQVQNNLSTGNDIICGGNFFSAGTVSGVPVNGVQPTIGGNISAVGNILAGGNINSGGDLSSGGNISAAGTVTAGQFKVMTPTSDIPVYGGTSGN